MTNRLYYDDAYLSEFTAEVVDIRTSGGKTAVTLDRSAFYPTSGGQPHDTGILGGARVLEVLEEEDTGNILHVLESPPDGGRIAGRIDWDRRFDHMQQHTGQHILSQAFIRVAGASTLSFHLGRDNCTIDVDLAQPTPAILREVEDLASRIAFENRAVQIHTIDRAELAALSVRKETRRDGPIRVIEVENFDRSACGGTHVRRTGEIGIIAVLGCERYKGGTRVEFACGGRVLEALRQDHETLKNLGRIFSAHPLEVPRLAEKLLDERSALSRETLRLEQQILEFEAMDLVRGAGTGSGPRIVQKHFADRSIESLKVLAQKIAAHGRTIAVLAAGRENLQIVVARSADVPGHCGAAVQKTSAAMGGKGGGRPELAQAGGIPGENLEGWFQSLALHLTAKSS